MADSFTWPTPGLTITFQIAQNGTVNISSLHPPNSSPTPISASAQLPIHQLRLLGAGNYDRAKTSKALVSSYLATRQRYVSHAASTQGETHHLTILTRDDEASIEVSSRWSVYGTTPVVRSEVTVTNRSKDAVTLTSLPSLVIGGLTSSTPAWWHAYKIHTATSSWFREAQWRAHSMPDTGVDVCLHPRLPASFHTFGVGNRGSFSTGSYLPMGIFARSGAAETWAWQVEAPGSWRWEVGDWGGEVYVAATGPTGMEHGWEEVLEPGASFTSVAAAVGRVDGGSDEAVQALTRYRRAMRRRHQDNEDMSIIFNDYMNCLMGDPTAAKVRALIAPARDAGAEAFVIDAGWYADEEDWWDGIGEWVVSAKRFPDGLDKTLQEIADAGMRPGLWLEPECVGIKSAMVSRYPAEAFFTHRGHRVMERDRYVLDFRCKEVVEYMDETVARLVAMGARYFKFDYNVEVIQGTDAQGDSPGAGHLRHNRAYMAWVASLFDRFPGLVIENCSSGAQRMDYAMLALHPLQSTSDQEDPIRYAAVSAAIASAVTPEQGASWAYPQPDWSEEVNAFTVVNSLLGRVHLSGRLDLLSSEQAKLVKDGMDVYKSIRQEIRTAVPFWPLGFPKWHDDWLAFGLKCESRSLVSVWRRGGGESCELPIAHLGGQETVEVKLLYPASFSADLRWDGKGTVVVKLPDAPCARLFSLE